MKILAVSDLRVQATAVLARIVARERPDLIVYAGDDVARFGVGPDSWSGAALLARHGLVGVLGNDCEYFDAAAFDQPGCRDLGSAPVIIDGVAFIGLPGAPSDEAAGRGSVLYTRGAARAHLKSQLKAVGDLPFVLVSHAPPLGILDLAVRFGTDAVGSSVVRELVDHPRCRAVICGHVHSEGGRSRLVGTCMVLNIASHDAPGSPLRFSVLTVADGDIAVVFGEEREHHEITRLPGVGPTVAVRLDALGIRSWSDVLEDQTGAVARVMGARPAARLRLQVEALSDGEVRITGEERPLPEDMLYLDIEYSHDRNDQPWLIGVSAPGQPVTQFLELDPAAHGEQLIALDALVRSSGCSAVVSWGAADRTVLGESFDLHHGYVPEWITGTWIDAYNWTKRALVLPLESAKLKVVAPWAGFRFQNEGIEGLDVGKMYARYRDSGEAFDVDLIRSYNRDDVLALRYVVEHVNALLRHAATPRVDVPSAIPAPEPVRAPVPHPAPSDEDDLERRIVLQVERYAEALWPRFASGAISCDARDDAIEAYERHTRANPPVRRRDGI